MPARKIISPTTHTSADPPSRYPASEFIELVQQHNIAYYEKTLGQLFCRTSSREIVDLLRTECHEAGVQLRTECTIERIERTDRFRLQTNQGPVECESLIVATGALSFPKLGATDFGYRIAEQFNVPIIEPRRRLARWAKVTEAPIGHRLEDVALWRDQLLVDGSVERQQEAERAARVALQIVCPRDLQ